MIENLPMDSNDVVIVVDVQNDFCIGGSLAVNGADDKYIYELNNFIRLVDKKDISVLFSQDWHPANHCSFTEYGGIWPSHCVENTWGAELHPSLFMPNKSLIVRKGRSAKKDEYSAFEANEMNLLASQWTGNIYVVGVALEYCVTKTALGALPFLSNNKKIFVISSLVRSISEKKEDVNLAYQNLTKESDIVLASSYCAKKDR